MKMIVKTKGTIVFRQEPSRKAPRKQHMCGLTEVGTDEEELGAANWDLHPS